MPMLNAEQKEELRHAVLTALALRHPAALHARQLVRAVAKELPYAVTAEDVAAACELLAGLTPPLAAPIDDPLGSSRLWRASSAGVLQAEREELR